MVEKYHVIHQTQRSDLGTKYQCQATNTNLTTPVVREAEVVLNCECAREVQGDTSGCSQGLVGIKTKAEFSYILLILKCNLNKLMCHPAERYAFYLLSPLPACFMGSLPFRSTPSVSLWGLANTTSASAQGGNNTQRQLRSNSAG